MYLSRKKSRELPSRASSPSSISAAGGALGKLAASGELTGKMLEFTLVHFAPGIGCAAHRSHRRRKARKVRHRRIAQIGQRRGALSESALGEAHRFPRARRRTRRRKRRRPLPRACCWAISTATNTARTRKIRRWNRRRSWVSIPPRRAASNAAASSPNRRISLASSATSLPICLRRACWPSAPKPWLAKLALPSIFSTKSVSRN